MTALYLHEDVKELLAGKTLVVLGDSVERSVYKDLVCLLQENRYLTDGELRKKGEESFIGDELVYGGVKGELKNSINYRECRYYKADNEACCRYYFVTICYGDYVEEILQELSLEPTDIIVMNSCLWDVHRHGKKGIEKYEENLEKLVASLRRLLPDCLFIWLTTPPVHIKSKGGFLIRPGVDTVKIQEVKYCNEIAREVFTAANEIDRRFRIVDLDYVFQYFAHHRAGDGVHWNERAHRRMSNMILEEISKAFNKSVPRILGSDEFMWNGSRTEHNAYYEPPPPYSQWDDPERLSWDYEQRFHDNGWDFDKMRRPPPPRGYPFGPPPPPGPFGPPSLMPRPFMEDPRSIMPNMFDDLDDLGHARLQVESQIESRKRKRTEEDDNDDEKNPEKQYRFGVAPSALKRKAEPIEDETKKIKIIEEEGVMKKVVTLEDSVIYSPMSEKEKTAYLKAQAEKAEKERLAKERKEKEEKQRAERLERERLQKLKKEEEESAAAAEEEKKRTESTADEKPAISPKEGAEAKFPKLQEALSSVSKLPLVSSVPKSTEEQTEKETTNEKKQGGLSKFASKLLSFIRRPSCEKTSSDNENQSKSVRRLSSKDAKVISPTKTTPLRRRVYEVIPLGELAAKVLLQNESNSKSNQSTHEQLNKLTKTSRQVECDRTSHVEEGDAGNISTSSVSTVLSTTVPPRSTTVSTTTTTPAIPKKVDTLALLSLQSPFAKSKSNAALVDTDKNANAEKSSVDKQNSKTEEQLEQELLNDSELHEPDVVNSTLENQSSKAGTTNTLTENKIDQKEGPSASSEKEPTTKTVKTTSESTESSDKKIQKCQGEGSAKKKKKKDKHADETKEERLVRKQKKREKKKLKEENKQRKLLAAQNAGTYQQNINWNVPLRQHNINSVPRQRSATWAPSYFHAYQNRGHNTRQPTLQRQQQPTPQQQVPNATPQVILNPYQQMLQTQLLQQQQQQQQQQQMMQQRQQILAQQQQQQQQLAQQQALLQQQKTQATQQTIKKPTSQTQQLYIDEYGQTYTLEEETYIVGPSGQIQNISSGSSYIQQQQQQGTQYLQSSLLYPQQRFL